MPSGKATHLIPKNSYQELYFLSLEFPLNVIQLLKRFHTSNCTTAVSSPAGFFSKEKVTTAVLSWGHFSHKNLLQKLSEERGQQTAPFSRTLNKALFPYLDDPRLFFKYLSPF